MRKRETNTWISMSIIHYKITLNLKSYEEKIIKAFIKSQENIDIEKTG